MRFFETPTKFITITYIVLFVGCGMQPNMVRSSKNNFPETFSSQGVSFRQDTPKKIITQAPVIPQLTPAQMALQKQYLEAMQDVHDTKGFVKKLLDLNSQLASNNEIFLKRAKEVRLEKDSLKNIIDAGANKQMVVLNKIFKLYENEHNARMEDQKKNDADRLEGRAFRSFMKDSSNISIGILLLLSLIVLGQYLRMQYYKNKIQMMQLKYD